VREKVLLVSGHAADLSLCPCGYGSICMHEKALDLFCHASAVSFPLFQRACVRAWAICMRAFWSANSRVRLKPTRTDFLAVTCAHAHTQIFPHRWGRLSPSTRTPTNFNCAQVCTLWSGALSSATPWRCATHEHARVHTYTYCAYKHSRHRGLETIADVKQSVEGTIDVGQRV